MPGRGIEESGKKGETAGRDKREADRQGERGLFASEGCESALWSGERCGGRGRWAGYRLWPLPVRVPFVVSNWVGALD
eukprot:3619188-Rhodomonas_salina.1